MESDLLSPESVPDMRPVFSFKNLVCFHGYRNVFCLSSQQFPSLPLLKERLSQALIYEAPAKFIKNLKRFSAFYQDFKSRQVLKNLMLCVFHPKHPFNVCFGAEHLD